MSITSLTAHHYNHFVSGGGMSKTENVTVIVPKPYVSKEHFHSDQYFKRLINQNQQLIVELENLISAFSLPKDSTAALLIKSINED